VERRREFAKEHSGFRTGLLLSEWRTLRKFVGLKATIQSVRITYSGSCRKTPACLSAIEFCWKMESKL